MFALIREIRAELFLQVDFYLIQKESALYHHFMEEEERTLCTPKFVA
jgi:hypothetical protein